MVDEELEEKVQKSIEEGYTREEILTVMKENDYAEHEIGKAIALADGTPAKKPPGEQGEDGGEKEETEQTKSYHSPTVVKPERFKLVMALSVLFPPAAYFLIGKKKFAAVNLLTLNYLLLGFVIVPLHVYQMCEE